MTTVTSPGVSSRSVRPAAWLALIATSAALVLLAALHVLSPEFAPSWRMVSEYAFGHHAQLLSTDVLMLGHRLVGVGGGHLERDPQHGR